MFNKIIKWSLDHAKIVVLFSLVVTLLGVWSYKNMKVDVLPDINKPTVAIFTEGEGMSAEDIEKLILTPVESAVSGAPGVTRVRGTASYFYNSTHQQMLSKEREGRQFLHYQVTI